MKKTIIALLTVMLNIISLSGQSRTETYDYFMVPKEFEYTYTDEDGYKSTKRFIVKSATLDFKNNELVGFTLKSDSKAQASFKVYKFINNTPKGKQFWVDDSMQYFVTIVNLSEVEDGLAIVFTSNINGYPIFSAHFKKRLTAEEKAEQKQIKEAQEQAKIAKEKADSIAAIERIQEYTQRVDKSNIQSLVEDFEIEYYKKHTDMLRRDLYNGNNTGSGLFAYNLEKEYEVYLYVDAQSLKAIKINRDVLDRNIWYSNEVSVNPKKYEIDGVTYIVYGNGFVYKTEVKTNLYAGYSNGGGFVVQKKKDKITYKEIIGSSSMGYILGKEINSNDIPSIVSLKLDEILSENGKYEVEYIFADNTLLFLLVTTKQRTTVVYRLLYNDLGEIEISGLLADTK